MKREILCEGCARDVQKMFALPEVTELVQSAPEGLASDERIRMVRGELRLQCLCDACGVLLPVESRAWACSLWSTRYGIPWREWEPEYLAPVVTAEAS